MRGGLLGGAGRDDHADVPDRLRAVLCALHCRTNGDADRDLAGFAARECKNICRGPLIHRPGGESGERNQAGDAESTGDLRFSAAGLAGVGWLQATSLERERGDRTTVCGEFTSATLSGPGTNAAASTTSESGRGAAFWADRIPRRDRSGWPPL